MVRAIGHRHTYVHLYFLVVSEKQHDCVACFSMHITHRETFITSTKCFYVLLYQMEPKEKINVPTHSLTRCAYECRFDTFHSTPTLIQYLIPYSFSSSLIESFILSLLLVFTLSLSLSLPFSHFFSYMAEFGAISVSLVTEDGFVGLLNI